MEYFIDKDLSKYDKNNIDDKKRIVEDLKSLVLSFTNQVEKEHWTKKIAEKLDVSEKVLFDTFNKEDYPQKRFNDKEIKSKSEPVAQDRKNNIQIQIMGIMVSDSETWKESIKKYKKEIEKSFSNQKVVDIILNKGNECEFNFDKLLDKLKDENQKAYLRKLYFENLERGEEFSSLKERMEAVDKYFIELRKEINKSKTEELVKGIKEAESNGNKARVKELTKELAGLSKSH